MKRLILLLSIIFYYESFGKFVPINRARQVALNYYNYIFSKQFSVSNIIYEESTIYTGYYTRHTFVFSDSNFVVVSADDRTAPIFAYSMENSWSFTSVPPAYKMWMEVEYDMWVRYLIDNNIQDSSFLYLWEEIENKTFTTFKTMATNSVGPLLVTKWGQAESNDGIDKCAYNYYAPTTNNSQCSCGNNQGSKCYAGCVAVAVAQIMRYWKSPAGQFEWCLMPDKLVSSKAHYPLYKKNIADLIKQTGSKSNSHYCFIDCETFALPKNANKAFINFGYSTSGVVLRGLTKKWVKRLQASLDAGKPVFYAGVNSKFEGHAFVCDGYQNKYFFHFNFGWNGGQDGWYYVKKIKGKSPLLEFRKLQRAIFDITPGGGGMSCPPCNNVYAISNYIEDTSYFYNIPVITWNDLPPQVADYYKWINIMGIYSPPPNSNFVIKNNNYYLEYFTPIKEGEFVIENVIIPSQIDVEVRGFNGITIKNIKVEKGAYFKASADTCPTYYINSKSNQRDNYSTKLLINKTISKSSDIFKEMISIYPNPCSDFFTIKIMNREVKNNYTVLLYNILGDKVYEKNFTQNTPLIDIQNIPKGIYICSVIIDGNKIYKKLIIK